jgi:maleate isomerase
VNQAIHAFLTAQGLDIVEFGSFHLRTEPEIASVPPDAIVAAGHAVAVPGAEAIFISCTGLQGHAAIAALEAATGTPVVTSNQAQVWEALSLINYGRPLRGYGRLLEKLAPARAA